MTRTRVVKVRVTEAEYADWTQQALEANQSLSETIRRAMDAGRPFTAAGMAKSITEALGRPPVGSYDAYLRQMWTTDSETAEREGRPRRTVSCFHGKPGFAYCPECDG